MAARKRTTGKSEGKAGVKRSRTKKGAAKGATADASVASETAAKSATPKKGRTAKKAPGTKPGGTKKAGAAAIKLNDRQRDLLKKVGDTGEGGYRIGQKTEQRTIDALLERKLLKRGAKDKESGTYQYHVSKTGQKHLTTKPPEPPSSPPAQ